MGDKKLFISESPRSVIAVIGFMTENFSIHQEVILVNPETRAWYPKIIRRIIDCDDNGRCVLDLYY